MEEVFKAFAETTIHGFNYLGHISPVCIEFTFSQALNNFAISFYRHRSRN